jgi:hypothetical protein
MYTLSLWAPCDDLVDDNWPRWILRLGLEIGSRRADAKRGEPGEARSQSTVSGLPTVVRHWWKRLVDEFISRDA